MKNRIGIFALLLCVSILLSACGISFTNDIGGQNALFIGVTDTKVDALSDVPEFDDEPYVIINDNKPFFTDDDLVTKSYERYSSLDSLGRCGVTMACVGIDIMPTKERGSIGQVKPTGWHTVKYDNVDGKYLYNRCHLIGYQLTGENANAKNLITGTRYLNLEGMLPFENLIADYVKETENHVLYRVTPIFEGDNLLASGVQMEGFSVEDNGEGICFNVYAYNAQPYIVIDYATGESRLAEKSNFFDNNNNAVKYVLNTSSKKFHTSDCGAVNSIKENNKQISDKTRDELIKQGYEPCKQCNP